MFEIRRNMSASSFRPRLPSLSVSYASKMSLLQTSHKFNSGVSESANKRDQSEKRNGRRDEHLGKVLFGQGELRTHDASHLLPLLEVDLVVLIRVALVKDLEQVVDEPSLDLPERVTKENPEREERVSLSSLKR